MSGGLELATLVTAAGPPNSVRCHDWAIEEPHKSRVRGHPSGILSTATIRQTQATKLASNFVGRYNATNWAVQRVE